MKNFLKYTFAFALFQMFGVIAACAIPFSFELLVSFIQWNNFDIHYGWYRAFGIVGVFIATLAYIRACEDGVIKDIFN